MFVGVGVGVGRQRFAGGFVGLLDLYPSASVAYSLRKLSSTYTGNAIRVRRASDNTEQNIGFDALGDLDTTTLTTFCTGTNGFVTTWYDQSGNGRNVTQTNATNQPQIVSSGSVILQGLKPCLRFDGSNDRLITTSNFTKINQPFTAISVSKENDQNDAIIASSSSSSPFVQYTVGGNYTLFNGSNLNSGISHSLNNKVLSSVSNSTNSRMWLNQISGLVGSSGSNWLENFEISGYYNNFQYLGGDVQEAILWATNQSSNILTINQLIQNYYGIA